MNTSSLEQACWMDWRGSREWSCAPEYRRVYFGHETCEELLPPRRVALGLARWASERGLGVSLVTPFLTQRGLRAALSTIERMRAHTTNLEVICSDWGLLHHLSNHELGEPVMGRLLVGQHTDPRLARMSSTPARTTPRLVLHVDGTLCALEKRAAPPPLAAACRALAVDDAETVAYFSERGVRRAEVSNVAQGIALCRHGWSFSLHVPWVPLTVMRRCPGPGESLTHSVCAPGVCRVRSSSEIGVEWATPSFEHRVVRRDNALWYENPTLPANLDDLPIDRMVWSS